MSSYFTLEMDTTGPIIQINAPSYTSREANNTITVVGNEKLSSFQDIYIVDSQGTRHDVIFSFDGESSFTGNIVFNGYPVGVLTIFAQLQDEVGNQSNLATAHITLIVSTYYSSFRLTMSDESRGRVITESKRTSTISIITSPKTTTTSSKEEDLSIANRTSTSTIIASSKTMTVSLKGKDLSIIKRTSIVNDTN